MVKRKTEKVGKAAKIFSGIFFLAGLAILVFIGISLGKETYRKKQIQKEIESLQAQISDLSLENGELSDLISYLSTREFQEKEAREKLNLQKDDERMVILKKDIEQIQKKVDESKGSEVSSSENSSPNWIKWWNYFLASK